MGTFLKTSRFDGGFSLKIQSAQTSSLAEKIEKKENNSRSPIFERFSEARVEFSKKTSLSSTQL